VLSYRHAFHVGNFADVLKHIVLIECITRLAKKDKPLLCIDTHAGAGAYRLDEGFAVQNKEWEGGIGRLADFSIGHAPPDAVARYLEIIRKPSALHSGGGSAAFVDYPGSPAIAAGILRAHDRLALFELHPNDHAPLAMLFAEDRRVLVRKADGFTGLRSLLPPASRRAFALVDPPYELEADYDAAVAAVSDAMKRFATGVYAVWYPCLEKEAARNLPGRITALADKSLDVCVRIRTSLPGERGMSGSGLVILNPPWQLKEALEETLPYLVSALGDDSGAGCTLTSRE